VADDEDETGALRKQCSRYAKEESDTSDWFHLPSLFVNDPTFSGDKVFRHVWMFFVAMRAFKCAGILARRQSTCALGTCSAGNWRGFGFG
jgi:hypothetical protein